MSHRPLALVSGLTVGDYLLWNWSLNHSHDVLALIAGLTLLPLGAAWVWLLTLGLARLLARSARRGSSISARRRGASTLMDRARGPAAGVHARGGRPPASTLPRLRPHASSPLEASASTPVSDRIRRLLPRSKRARLTLAALVLLLAGLALGGYLYERHRTGSIYHPHARFVPQPTPKLPPRGPDRFAWPFYGYTKNHTRFFPAPASLHPPFRRLWVHNAGSLLEFPPVIYGDHIFQLADDGVLSAINKHTGHTFWQRRLGRLSASTPAVTATPSTRRCSRSANGGSPGASSR